MDFTPAGSQSFFGTDQISPESYVDSSTSTGIFMTDSTIRQRRSPPYRDELARIARTRELAAASAPRTTPPPASAAATNTPDGMTVKNPPVPTPAPVIIREGYHHSPYAYNYGHEPQISTMTWIVIIVFVAIITYISIAKHMNMMCYKMKMLMHKQAAARAAQPAQVTQAADQTTRGDVSDTPAGGLMAAS